MPKSRPAEKLNCHLKIPHSSFKIASKADKLFHIYWLFNYIFWELIFKNLEFLTFSAATLLKTIQFAIIFEAVPFSTKPQFKL